MARRLGELPETKAALEAGELSEDQAAVVCRWAPAHADAEVATLARSTTVTQLRRTLLSYSPPESEEKRRVSFGYTDDGSWSLSALLPADEGALWERALITAREELFRTGEAAVSWADALVAVADRSLATAAASRPHRDRHLVMLHTRPKKRGSLGATCISVPVFRMVFAGSSPATAGCVPCSGQAARR